MNTYYPSKIVTPITKELSYPSFVKSFKNGDTKQYEGRVLEGVIVDIVGEEYTASEIASREWWANEKKGAYGRGLSATKEDAYKPVRTGILGQMAFGKYVGVGVDLMRREGGDEYDNLIDGKTYDIKCSTYDRKEGLVYGCNAGGYPQRINKDYYVFGHINYDNQDSNEAQVVLMGWVTDKELLEKGYVERTKVHGANHSNFVAPYSILNPIENLRCVA